MPSPPWETAFWEENVKAISFGLFTALASVFVTSANAQETYPSSPVTWVVPFSAGGPTDALARLIAQRVSEELGQNILIENVQGAGGTIGAGRVANAEPDGQTFLVGHLGYMAAAPSMYPTLPYDPVEDLTPVFRFPDTPLVLLVGPQSPYDSVDALIAFGRENPDTLMFSNAGIGSTSHLVAAMFAAEAEIDITPIPYPGAGPALTDLVGGRVDAMFDQTNTALAQVEGGQVRALGITSAEENDKFPGVAPIGAQALPGFDVATWYGIYAPAGTPDAMIETMYEAYSAAMQDTAFTDRLVDLGIVLLPPESYAPAALGEHTRAEVERWRGVIEEAGITIE